MASFRVELTAEARKELRNAPGHLRARILQVLHTLEHDQKPTGSCQLDVTQLKSPLSSGMSLWRIRLDAWRVIYVVDTEDEVVSVLAIRRRPPYAYQDLESLVQQ
jgi:mRNA interferase RelE/StbE